MRINLRFDGQHVCVFGGTSGINFGIAAAFAEQGSAVTVFSRQQSNVTSAVDKIIARGGKANGYSVDVRDAVAVERALEQCVVQFGDIDVVISGAAGNFLCEAKDMSVNGFRTIVDIDLIGTFNVVRHAYKHLHKPGGRVINITAPQASVPMRYQVHAAAAKAGVDQLTRNLALEWGRDGVCVNAISPGPIKGTEGFSRLMAESEEELAASQAFVPLGRIGTIDDVANVALFLASPYAAYLSGAIIPCDGGGALESVKPALELAGQKMNRSKI